MRLSRFLVLLALLPAACEPPPPPLPAAGQVSACFTPQEYCGDWIVGALDSAKTEIRVQAYQLTAPDIIDALERAQNRGLDVEVILDKSQAPSEKSLYSHRAHFYVAPVLATAGIKVWIDHYPAIAHTKVMIIDQHLVVGGSYNYTLNAELRNTEDVTLTDSPVIAARFLENWNGRRNVSMSYAAPEPLWQRLFVW